jgi:hypothetical protein
MSKIVKGTKDRVTGTVGTAFGTFTSVLGRARNVAVGTLGVAKGIVTLDAKGVKRDVQKVGRSAVGAVSNVVSGTVKTARVAVTGKTGSKTTRKTNKKSRK